MPQGKKERKGTKKTKLEEKDKKQKKLTTTRKRHNKNNNPPHGPLKGGKLKAENDQVHQAGPRWSDDEAREKRKSHSI